MEIESELTGVLLEELPSRKEVTWEIYDYYTLSRYSDYILHSPRFSFAGARWCIIMYLDKCASSDVLLCLKRTDDFTPSQQLHCELGIYADGVCCGGIGELSPGDCDRGCYVDVFHRGVLDDKKDSVAPEGILRVYCKLYFDRKSIAEAASQTESCLMNRSALSQDLEKLLISGDDSDVTIQLKGKVFRAHRAILGARTPVFASMFKVDMTENISGVVAIDDCESESFGHFLNFIYTGNLNPLSPQKAISLYPLADKYDVAELKSGCLEFMKNNLSKETLFDIVRLALRHSEDELLKLAIQFFCQNIKKIIKTISWQTFMSDCPTAANELLNKAIGDEDEEGESS